MEDLTALNVKCLNRVKNNAVVQKTWTWNGIIHAETTSGLHIRVRPYLTVDKAITIAVLSEIWSCNIQFYHNIRPDYKFHYALPNDTSVGGAGTYTKSKYSQTVVKDYAINSSDTSRNENLWIQIINGKTKYIIGGIYRHLVVH